MEPERQQPQWKGEQFRPGERRLALQGSNAANAGDPGIWRVTLELGRKVSKHGEHDAAAGPAEGPAPDPCQDAARLAGIAGIQEPHDGSEAADRHNARVGLSFEESYYAYHALRLRFVLPDGVHHWISLPWTT